MIRLRSLIAVLLSLMLALTSVSMAVARGQDPRGMDMVICAGADAVTITLDVRGNPVKPTHLCPDCLSGVTALWLTEPAAGPQRPLTRSEAAFQTDTAAVAGLAPPEALARGPPVLI